MAAPDSVAPDSVAPDSVAPDSVAVDSAPVAAPRPAIALPGRAWLAGVWAGAALHSEFATRDGPRYRDMYMAGVRFVSADNRAGDFALDYYVDVIPFIRSTNTPIEYRANPCPPGPQPFAGSCGDYTMITESVSGYGLTPIGLQLRAFARSPVQLSLSLGLGVSWYHKPVPDPEEKRLNFMGDAGAGLQFRVRGSWVQASVRHNHTSNAGTGRVNPGLDSRVGYLGVVRPLGRRQKQ